ncbi:hypothetical protein S3E15_01447 [Bacillus mycoides]|uniref:Uncharacterized protein n=1 Tax=Bacillus mycoides TaxID=1405 RepID=A0AAP7W6K5_BACMY|nr:hypothetical protein bwei_2562 [Bacillus mycoides]KZD31280.1 hypothetical protein B4083_4661 [Bacillus cereus]KUH42218.1 hypothetical protein M2E15_2310 [Bacillus mycoides]KZE04993.1 hypothetical protein B4117_3480 [Bacillus mycoides]OSX90819.1 hypothetical protein S3E15_01447 [Bacillus mycoides]
MFTKQMEFHSVNNLIVRQGSIYNKMLFIIFTFQRDNK